MASYIERGDSLFIPFRDGVSISDSQCRPRMYKSVQNFENSFPTHNLYSSLSYAISSLEAKVITFPYYTKSPPQSKYLIG